MSVFPTLVHTHIRLTNCLILYFQGSDASLKMNSTSKTVPRVLSESDNVYVLPATADIFNSINTSFSGQSRTIYVGQLETATNEQGETSHVVELTPRNRTAPAVGQEAASGGCWDVSARPTTA